MSLFDLLIVCLIVLLLFGNRQRDLRPNQAPPLRRNDGPSA
jgi:hypothetical protein